MPRGDHPFHTNGKCRGAVRNLAFLGALDDRGKGNLENTIMPVSDLDIGPEKILEVLRPFKVGNDHAARVAQCPV